MADVARTPITPVRIPTELKEQAAEKAREAGTTLSAVVIAAVADYVSGKWEPRDGEVARG